MMTGFLESWGLFGDAYGAALASALLLSLVGVMVVGRNQVFLAAAVAQASLLGIALDLLFQFGQPSAMAIGFSVAAALFTAPREKAGGTSHEEATGWVFLLAASISVLALANQPVGLKEVQGMLASSIIGATRGDAVLFGSLAAMTLAGCLMFRRPLVLLLCDSTMAAAVGMRVGAWSLGLAAGLGLATGLSLQTSGLLFTFGCLVLPGLIAKNLSRRAGTMFVIAPAAALAGVLAGLALAHHFNAPPGQVVVALLAGGLAAAWGFREIRGWMSGA